MTIKRFIKIVILVFSLSLVLMLFSGCGAYDDSYMAEIIAQMKESDRKTKGNEADRLGSWGSINQDIERSSDWRQIVTNSQFQLGEKTVKGHWKSSGDYYEIAYGTYPSIDGSTVALPMAIEFARQHLGFSDETANDFVGFSTTHKAYINLISKEPNGSDGMIREESTFLDDTHPVDIIIATDASEEESDLAVQEGVALIKKPVCYDAFVFITHKDSPIDSLTIEQIRDIYSGVVTNWKEVGGDDAPIIAYQRQENSGSQSGMIDLVMKDTPMIPPELTEIAVDMGDLINVVAEYKNKSSSIGYTYKYYIDNLYKNDSIKVIKIDGIPADEESIREGSYPLSTCYYGVIRSSDRNAAGGKFLDWILSEEGQACIKQAGYIPLS